MSRPVLLDLYSCAGGASMGYYRAGWDVVGVELDSDVAARYPFPVHVGDALTILRSLTSGGAAFAQTGEPSRWLTLGDIDAIAASPPCLASTALTKGNRKREGWSDTHVDLIPATRALLDLTGKPYVIENVQGAQMRRDLTLCGEMFGLGVIRHRYFELGGWSMPQPAHKPHRGRVRGWRHGAYYDGPYLAVHGDGGGKGTVAEWQQAMGIDWTDVRHDIAEAIPPAYTEHVGRQLLAHVTPAVAA